MAREVRPFQITIPAGTAIATPFRQSMSMPIRQVSSVEIVVPPGPSGLMGFAVTMGGVSVIPVVPGTYIVTDDERIVWPLTDLPTSGAWELTGYNLDVWPHSVYIRWLVDVVSGPTSQPLLSLTTMQALSSP